MGEKPKSKEERDLERLRAKYPDMNIQITPPELRAQHRIYIGPPPVAKPKGKSEEDI